MLVSIIIPTRSRAADTLNECLDVLVHLPDAEVVIAIDGPRAPASLDRFPGLTIVTGPKVGPAGARNRALRAATGDLILFLNDDVVPAPDLILAHRAAHTQRTAAGATPAIVMGAAPWAVAPDDRAIDRLVREMSLIFFYDQMTAADPGRDWGFRHAWTLNCSIPRAIAQDFDDRLRYPMFDDLEWAHRVCASAGAPVLFRPGAVAVHHHRYTPAALLRREALLGHQAPRLHEVAPDCGADVFGDRYSATTTMVAAARAHRERAIDRARAAFAGFVSSAALPAGSLDAPGAVATMFERCRPWREVARTIGFLAAIDGLGAEDAQRIALGELAGVGALEMAS